MANFKLTKRCISAPKREYSMKVRNVQDGPYPGYSPRDELLPVRNIYVDHRS